MSTKEMILAELIANGEISGEALAQKMGISRSAVWKAIAQLREEGHVIEAASSRGYRLAPESDVVSEAGVRHWLRAQEFGSEIEIHSVIDSTNTRAKALAAQGAPHGTLVCARTQTGGRGRFGRKFHSPDAAGIYMTLLIRPKLPAEKAVMITSMTAVAVARAIERLADVRVEIKWVNDLYIAGKKVCGILCEAGMDFESGQLEYAVVGIGVNTARAEFPEDIRDIATSVGNVCGKDISKNRLIAEICNCMEEMYGQLEDGAFMAESRARSNVIGRNILVLRGGERYPARAIDIDDQGSLVVETEDGIQTVRSGEVSVRWEETV
ncbi:MAG: biotin--[Clostridia bacterium]|nr:biotin--[acetyl-CoA-carboxylase] ligase [Clostridia bacterium]